MRLPTADAGGQLVTVTDHYEVEEVEDPGFPLGEGDTSLTALDCKRERT